MFDVLFLGDLRFFIPMRDNYIVFHELDVGLVARSLVPDDGFTTVLLVASLLSFLGCVSAALALVFSVMLIHSFNVGARNCAAPRLLLIDFPVTLTTPTAFPVVHRILLHVDLSFLEAHLPFVTEAQLPFVTKLQFRVFTPRPLAICDGTCATVEKSTAVGFQLCTEDNIGPLFPQSRVKSDFEDTSDDVADEIAWQIRYYAMQISDVEFRRQFDELDDSDLIPTTCMDLMEPVDKVPAGPTDAPITGQGMRTSRNTMGGAALAAVTTAATPDDPTNHEESNEGRLSVKNLKAMFER